MNALAIRPSWQVIAANESAEIALVQIDGDRGDSPPGLSHDLPPALPEL
jgi:hypothetical protein